MTIDVIDAHSAIQTIQVPLAPGRAAAVASRPVVLSTEDLAALTGPLPATQSGTWTVTGTGGTFPVTGTFWQATQPVSGTFWQATQPVSIASMPSTPVTGTFWQATQPVSLAAVPALVAGTALIGRAVADASAATGGIASTARLPSAANSANATNAKNAAGRVYSASGKNNAAYDVFLVLYETVTTTPVPGTTAIRKKVVCPAGQAFVYDWPLGLSFSTGIGYAFTKLVADADTTVIAAADITAFNLDYV